MKQVIILRKDLNMRKGKMIAQGAHASLMAVHGYELSAISEWLWTGQTKIVVGVNSEEELIQLFELAKAKKLLRSLVKDAGKTEFKEPTYTAVAIGPAEDSELNSITGHLKLL